jgi:Skp family chaperone for outer membrane proteins
MAEETQTAEAQDYERWLTSLGEEDDAAEAPTEHEEEVPAAVEDLEQRITAMERQRQVDAMLETFRANASAEAQELLEVYRSGSDEDPATLKRAMELALKNAEAAKLPLTEAAERQAQEIARDAYGVGPLTPGTPAGQQTPQEYYDQLAEKARKERDSHVSFQLWNALPANGETSTPD